MLCLGQRRFRTKKKEERKKERKYYDFKHTLASWSGLELARACAKFHQNPKKCQVSANFTTKVFAIEVIIVIIGIQLKTVLHILVTKETVRRGILNHVCYSILTKTVNQLSSTQLSWVFLPSSAKAGLFKQVLTSSHLLIKIEFKFLPKKFSFLG